MHAAYFRPGGVAMDVPQELLDDIGRFAQDFPRLIDDMMTVLTDNRIFKQRTVDIGVVSQEEALAWSFSGPMLRGIRVGLGST